MTLPELVMPADKQTLLNQMDREYAAFTALLLARPEDRRSEVWDDGRSFKDLAAHVGDWEAYALARVRNHYAPATNAAPRIRNKHIDEENAIIHEAHANATWAEAWDLLDSSHRSMRDYIAALPDADLFDDARSAFFADDPDTRTLWVIEYNTAHHYREHADEIRATVSQ